MNQNSQPVEPITESHNQPMPVTLVNDPFKILYSWESASRPFKKRTKEFYTNIAALIFLLCIILLFLKQIVLILVILALAFFVYTLSTVEPEKTVHKITTKGIETVGKKYLWEQLGRFWFQTKDKETLLTIENYFGLPNRIIMIVSPYDKDSIQSVLQKHLIEEKPEETQIEKMGRWLSEKFVLENSKPLKTTPKPSKK
jgi:hypothetical protein